VDNGNVQLDNPGLPVANTNVLWIRNCSIYSEPRTLCVHACPSADAAGYAPVSRRHNYDILKI